MVWALPVSATVGGYQTAVTNESSLISYYTFDQSNAKDVRALHDGTVAGGAAFATGVGDTGKSLGLATLGRVTLGLVPDFDFSDGTGTVELWVRADWSKTLTYNPCLVAARDGGQVNWSLHMGSDRRSVGMWNGYAYRTVAIPDAGANWHHLVVVFESGSINYYWDGAAAGTVAQDLGGAASTTQFGSSSSNVTAEGFPGWLDEIALYADALPVATVEAHYAAFFAGTPPVIVVEPRGGTYLPGVALTLKVGATGPSLTYQWQKNGSPMAGATQSTLAFASLGASDAATYRAVVSNPAGNVPSSDAIVALAGAVSAETIRYQQAVSNETSLVSYYTFDHLSPNDSKALYDGTLIGTADFGAGLGGGPSQGVLLDGTGHVGFPETSDFGFVDLTGTVEGWVRADWTSVGYAPAIFACRDSGLVTWSVHMEGNKKAIGIWNGSSYVTASIPDASTNWHHVAVVFNTGTNTIYWDGVARGSLVQDLGTSLATTEIGSSRYNPTAEGWVGVIDEVAFYGEALSEAAVQAHFKAFAAGTPPAITLSPAGGTFVVGNPLQMSVAAIGADLAYEWFKDGNPLPGATNTTFAVGSLSIADGGSYFVRVSNPAGETNSAAVLVQVGNYLSVYQGAVQAEPSLISYYTFDAGDGRDAKGTNAGVAANVVSYTTGVGLVTNQALLLDGTGHLDLGLVSDFDFANGTGTAEAWVRPDWTTASYAPCLFANRVASGFQVDWSLHMVQARDAMGNWNGLFFQTLGLVNPGGWHHFAVTFGGGKVEMYWDGQSVGSFGQAINLVTGLPTQIGSVEPGTTQEGWIGGIDEVAFYKATLGAGAIRNHYLAMVQGGTSAPTLSYARTGDQLTLSWPAEATGFTLESCDSLPPVTWQAVSGVANNRVTVQINGNLRFFRLKK